MIRMINKFHKKEFIKKELHEKICKELLNIIIKELLFICFNEPMLNKNVMKIY